MINADERIQATTGPNTQHGHSIPRCVCSWKNCRTYQKAFREVKHPVFDGVIKLRLCEDQAEALALKAGIDRCLRIPQSKATEWRREKGDQLAVRYTIARHHFTEQHIKRFLQDPRHYSFTKPFSEHGAKKYLFTVDSKETLQSDKDNNSELLYLQVPNVPKEVVRVQFLKLKEQVMSAGNHKSLDKKDSPNSVREHQAEMSPKSVDKPKVAEVADKLAPVSPISKSASSTTELQLKEKEEENKRLKDQLASMQSQLTFLHDMVKKLQEEHYENKSVARVDDSRHSRSANKRNNWSVRSNRSGVPDEIQLGDEEASAWNHVEEEWTEHYEDDEEEDDEEEDDEETCATFKATYKAQRRNSNDTKASRATSIVSASKSVKSLPREIELDEDDSEDHESLEEEAFDNRSFASTARGGSQHSRSDHYSQASAMRPSRGRHHQSMGPNSKMPTRRMSLSSASATSKGRSNGGAGIGGGSQHSANKAVSFESEDGSSTNQAGTYQVTAMIVTDPYGEKGTYTGSISHSTGMPHGYGRLEYDRAGRWYDGQWKHGRWTGYGRLSNGDGDYYEGGLKNDHKHGHGVMRFADGRTFEGEYINGQMIEGMMTYQDGSTYSGSWVDGMRHGRGKCVFTDGSEYEGEFRAGEFHGHGKMTWSDGGWYFGEWVGGEMHGKGKEVRPNGSLRHDGLWSKGQPIRRK